MKFTLTTLLVMSGLLVAGLAVDGLFSNGIIIKDAQAKIGRPLTPISYAGVARRTSRRVIRRTTVYVIALPRGCRTVIVEGMALHHCGGMYYQPYGNRFVVVNVN